MAEIKSEDYSLLKLIIPNRVIYKIISRVQNTPITFRGAYYIYTLYREYLICDNFRIFYLEILIFLLYKIIRPQFLLYVIKTPDRILLRYKLLA